MVATSSNRGFQVPTVGGDGGVWGNELNTTITDLDTMLGGSITFNASAAATVTLTTSQAQFGRIVFSGTPASSMVLNFNSTIAGPYGNFDVWNATSTSANGGAGFNILCQVTSTSTGATATIPISNMRLVNVDGQNVQFADQVIVPTTTLPPVLNGYISGLIMSNASSNSSNALAFTAGIATDTTFVTYMQNAASFNKTSSAVWALGSGNGGMGTGLSFSAGTTYHVFIISNGTSSNIDFYFDTSVSAANKPANTNYFRRIGSMITLSSAATWAQFTQNYDEFLYNSLPFHDQNAVTSFSTTPANITLTVPSGVKVYARGTVEHFWLAAGGGNTVYYFAPDATSVNIAGLSAGQTGVTGVTVTAGTLQNADIVVRTNNSAQISWCAQVTNSGGAQVDFWTYGWNDTRGK